MFLGVDLQMGCARHTTEGLATQAQSSKTGCSHLTLILPDALAGH